MTAETLRTWVRRAEVDAGARAGLTTGERERLRQLERENRELRRANEILKGASVFFRTEARPATAEMTRFIETHRERFGVEPICRELQVAPSTYYAARQRPRSARRIRDEVLQVKLRQVHAEHFGVYGARKLWRQLTREGIPVARCTVERLMRALSLSGVVRGSPDARCYPTSTRPDPRTWWSATSGRPPPNRLWVAEPHLRAHLVGLRLRRLHHRRLLPLHRGLAGVTFAAHRPRARRPGAGALEQAGPLRRACPSFRPRRAVPLDPLHRAGWPTSGRSVPWAAAATPTTTHWRSR